MDRCTDEVVVSEARGAARRGTALAGLLLALAAGCNGSGQLVPDVTAKPSPPVALVVAIWNNHVVAGVDPAHNGAPMYGLAGRVFLYGPGQQENVVADGKLVVELYATLTTDALQEPHAVTREFVRDRFRGLRATLAARIESGQQAGSIAADIDPQDAAALVIAASDGLQIQWLLDPDAVVFTAVFL